jgi:two-component system, LuxR family, response regulator FixJ
MQPPKASVRDGPVFIIDDEPAVLDALRLMLGTFGYACRTFLSAEEFLAALSPATPGCVIADVRLPGMSGLDLQKELARRGHGLPMIFISAHGDIRMAVAAVKAGAVDFLEKPIDDVLLVDCLRQALLREDVERSARGRANELAVRLQRLTLREKEVMALVIEGFSNATIGDRLGISPRTVEHYRASVMEKMQARNLSDLVRTSMLIDLHREQSEGGAPASDAGEERAREG